MASDVQLVGDGDLGVTASPVSGCQGDVVDTAVHGPSIAMFVSEEADQNRAVGGEHLSQLPSVIDVRALLSNGRKRYVASLA